MTYFYPQLPSKSIAASAVKENRAQNNKGGTDLQVHIFFPFHVFTIFFRSTVGSHERR